MSSAIQIQNVSKSFVLSTGPNRRQPAETFTALEQISLDVRAGEFVVIVGPSGVPPVVIRVCHVIGIEEAGGDLVEGVDRTSLEEQHRAAGVLGESCRQHRAR